MPTHSDLTFITNEKTQTLLERFKVLIKDTELFDILVGYFYTSGFHAICHSLEQTRKIRILIGINTSRQAAQEIEYARQQALPLSHAEAKDHCDERLVEEMDKAEDSKQVEEGVRKFLEWLHSGKLEIKAWPTDNLHAKLYILSFTDDDRDTGRVITGSSNFTRAGLVENLEFNVELKTRADYDFARQKFEDLWQQAIDVKDRYVQTLTEHTWLNETITPRQLYLKCLYEYFQDELNQTVNMPFEYAPPGFKRLEYQVQAVSNAKKILEEYGGVFISDVVGLGKTYVSAMLAGQLDGRTLVIAPPALIDRANPGSWPAVFADFRVSVVCESLGKLEHLIREGTDTYKNVFIDEAHRFRTEDNRTYEQLAQICRGKRVVLVTATPLNNTPKDILSQIKLFQNARQSTIPNVSDLESFFSRLEKKTRKLDRRENHKQYMHTTRDNSREIRESVLKYLMVRRTRLDVERHFAADLNMQGLSFPEVENPEAVFYKLNTQENAVFNETVELVVNQFRYARYTPLIYYEGTDKPDQMIIQSEKNLGSFMKILLIKRLESSFHAFQKTVRRFIAHYELFLKAFEDGNVYVSKNYAQKIVELLESGDGDAIQKLLDDDRARRYPAENFADTLKFDLEHDLHILREIQKLWRRVTRDPKLLSFVDLLTSHPVLRKNNSKLIVFSESRETVAYLAGELGDPVRGTCPNAVLAFSGDSSPAVRKQVIDNFDARARHPKDDYRILITTEVLAEGMNLHRSNVVINYDIPWNPTRLIQRVGRINRVGTPFKKIHSFNFFPTEQSNDQIRLKEAAEAKIQAFITLLGADARLLTDGEDIESHELFTRLISKKTITGEEEEDESELKYWQVIRDLRTNDPDLFETVKRLPKKARTARKHADKANQVLTYFRKGKLQKFFLAGEGGASEIDFMGAAGRLEADATVPRETLPADFYDKLEQNKQAFTDATSEESADGTASRSGGDSIPRLLKKLRTMRDFRQYTKEQEAVLQHITHQVEKGAFPQQTIKAAYRALDRALKQGQQDPLTLLAILKHAIPEELLESHIAETSPRTTGPREVVLSEYMVAD